MAPTDESLTTKGNSGPEAKAQETGEKRKNRTQRYGIAFFAIAVNLLLSVRSGEMKLIWAWIPLLAFVVLCKRTKTKNKFILEELACHERAYNGVVLMGGAWCAAWMGCCYAAWSKGWLVWFVPMSMGLFAGFLMNRAWTRRIRTGIYE